jgi:hypothetical protein
MSVLLLPNVAYALADDPAPEPEQPIESLRVEDVRLVGETLYATITDKETGLIHDLEINLREIADLSSEYLAIQLAGITGNLSDLIYIKNPFYIHSAESVNGGGQSNQNGDNPFTHDGTGTVVDNATDGDGKEFFGIETPDGNVFYLIIDRQRTSENVYLLNAVTENDLMSLAVEGDGKTGIVPEPPEVIPEPGQTEPENEPDPVVANSSDTGTIIFIIIAVIAAGGAGYYFKIVRPRQNADMSDDDEDEDEVEEQYDSDENDYEDEDESI